MGSQAILIVIVLSVCQGDDSQKYSAQKCHYAFFSEPRDCTEDLQPAVCSNGGVISITSIQYEDDNGNNPLGSSCCTKIDGDVSTDIKENLYKECNNKSSCKFDSLNSGTLKIEYTCIDMYENRTTKEATTMATTEDAVSLNPHVHRETSKETISAPDRSNLATSDVGLGTSFLYQYTSIDMYENRTTKEATTMATTEDAVSLNPHVHRETSKDMYENRTTKEATTMATTEDAVSLNPHVHRETSKGLFQILIASLLGVFAVLITAAILVVVACKRRKKRKLLRQPDDYELESSTRIPVLEANARHEVPEEMNMPNDEQDNEYDKATFAMSHANAKRDGENTYDVASAFGDQKHVTMSGDNVYDVATNLPKVNGTNAGDNDYSMAQACINNKCINGDDEDGYEQTSYFANNSNATTNEENVYDLADHNIKN